MTPTRWISRPALAVLGLAVATAARPCAARAPARLAAPAVRPPAAAPAPPPPSAVPPLAPPAADAKPAAAAGSAFLPPVAAARVDPTLVDARGLTVAPLPPAGPPVIVLPGTRTLRYRVAFVGPDGAPLPAEAFAPPAVAAQAVSYNVVDPAGGLDLGYDQPNAFLPFQIVSPFLPTYDGPWPPVRNRQVEIRPTQPAVINAPPAEVVESGTDPFPQ